MPSIIFLFLPACYELRTNSVPLKDSTYLIAESKELKVACCIIKKT